MRRTPLRTKIKEWIDSTLKEPAMSILTLVEDEIGRKLKEASQTGELKTAPSYGKPLPADDGWNETPEEFRLAFKALKDSGFVPPEIAAFHERARLREAVSQCIDPSERQRLAAELASLDQTIALRLEGMRANGSL
jgi:Domain of unknown function (DUF1992)